MKKHYALRKMRCLLAYVLFFTAVAVASAQSISGKVTDEGGQPLPGVNVVEKGTTNGTTTSSDGTYSLRVGSSEAVLSFSFIGYTSKEESVGNRTTIDLTLSPSAESLEEVVVVGYGTQKRKDLTGAVASANLEAFRESPNVSILQSLKGSLPGLVIGQTNQAGQEASIQIRGTSTLNGNTSPLIIVDGLIFNGRLSDISPADVASVDVLKDPSSKAIYGSQAANGVILITTKTGRTNQKPTISYSGSYATSSPTVHAKLLDRDAFLTKVRDIEYLRAYTKESGYTEIDPTWDFTKTSLNPALVEGIAAGNDYDWYGNLTQPALITNHALSVAGGSEKTTYFLSTGYTGEKGFIKNDNYKRYTLRLNLDTEVTPWLTIGANTSGAFADFSGDAPDVGTIAKTAPVVLPRDANGDFVINPVGDANLNPFLNATNDNHEAQSRLVGNFYGIVRLPGVPGLSYRANFGNNLKFFNTYESSIYGAGRTGLAFKNNAMQYEQTLDNILNYTKTIGKHSINVTGVYGYNTLKFERTGATGQGFTDLSLSYNNLALAEIQRNESSAYGEKLLYQLLSASYNYGGRYLLKATVRRDGFSGFSANNKTALFPSVGLGWVLSEEPFFKVPGVDFLKIRGSYGENGNKVDRYSSLAVVQAGDNSKYVFGDGASTSIGRSVQTLANKDLKWERTRGINVGIDFAILKNRIDGNIEYYNSNTSDLLWSKILPQTSGFAQVLTNIGKLNNTGFEFLIHGQLVKTNNLSWDVSVNFSTNKNKIVSLLGEDRDGDGKEEDLIANKLFIGRSIGTVFDYQVDGVYNLTDERPTGFAPGSYRVIDQNNDGKIAPEDDRVVLGRTEPAYLFGIQNTVAYRQFALRFFINSTQGGKNGYFAPNYPDGGFNTPGNATNANWFDFYEYWSPRNPNAKYSNTWVNTPVPGARAYYQRNFVRLQDISLSYTFDKRITDKLKMQNLKVFVSGKNLLTITDWDGWDPEVSPPNQNLGQGITSSYSFPVMKSYSFGLEVSF